MRHDDRRRARAASGPFEVGHRSLQSGLRAWVERQTGHPLGYLEQLYTFADREPAQARRRGGAISISYLGLTRAEAEAAASQAAWRRWYDYFPWEDHRAGAPPADRGGDRAAARAVDGGRRRRAARAPQARAAIAFGLDGRRWNEELSLQRYELLYEAGLVAEARRRRRASGRSLGTPMIGDHRRILATGIARLRAKIKYNPVVFELMPPAFTLLQLQRCVEAIAGTERAQAELSPPDRAAATASRRLARHGRHRRTPAKAFRFREAVQEERAVVGTKLPIARA